MVNSVVSEFAGRNSLFPFYGAAVAYTNKSGAYGLGVVSESEGVALQPGGGGGGL
jgi:hypothetical protein